MHLRSLLRSQLDEQILRKIPGPIVRSLWGHSFAVNTVGCTGSQRCATKFCAVPVACNEAMRTRTVDCTAAPRGLNTSSVDVHLFYLFLMKLSADEKKSIFSFLKRVTFIITHICRNKKLLVIMFLLFSLAFMKCIS